MSAQEHDEESPIPSPRERSALLVQVLPNQFGLRVFFGQRSKTPIYEGLKLKIPWAHVIEVWSMNLGTNTFQGEFFSKNNLKVEAEGSIQWRPDPTIKVPAGHRKDHVVFPTRKQDVIRQGVNDRVANIIAALGGLHDGRDFVDRRSEVTDLINSVLRIGNGRLLHMNHRPSDKEFCGVDNCSYQTGVIRPEDQLAFYKDHVGRVRELLAKEPENPEDHSETELLYGIDIATMEFSKFGFTEETNKAMEEAQQAELRQEPIRKVLATMDELRNRGVSGEAAGPLAAALNNGTDDFPVGTTVINIAGLQPAIEKAAEIVASVIKSKS